MSKHSTTVEGFNGTPEELAERICALRYDELALLFARCAVVLICDANKDAEAGRRELAVKLTTCASHASLLSMQVADAMRLCAKYMHEVRAEDMVRLDDTLKKLIYWRKKEHL